MCITHTSCQVETHNDDVQNAYMANVTDPALLSEMALRLKEARTDAGFKTAKQAAKYFGFVPSSYYQHENGKRGLKIEVADRYGRAYGVRGAWLLTGDGPKEGPKRGSVTTKPKAVKAAPAPRIEPTISAESAPSASVPSIPVTGFVSAGGAVDWVNELPDQTFVHAPAGPRISALIVRGESQYPRFLDGEAVLYETEATTTEDLLGHYAIVHTADGRDMIKILRRDPKRADRYRLESHNFPLEDNVKVLWAHRYVGVLAQPGTRPPQGRRR